MRQNRKSKIAHRFGAKAPIYDAHAAAQEHIAQSLAARLPDLKAPRILEIGCGTGLMSKHLLERYPDGTFTITDISAPMLAKARENISPGAQQKIDWRQMDGEAPDLLQQYDLIVANMVFHWFIHKNAALKSLLGMLCPGGMLHYTIPGPCNFPEWREALRTQEPALEKCETLPGETEEEIFTIDYGSTLEFLRTLKRTGADLPEEGYHPLSPDEMQQAIKICDEKHAGKISWQILYRALHHAA